MSFYHGSTNDVALRLVQMRDGKWYARSKNTWFPTAKTPVQALIKATTVIQKGINSWRQEPCA